MNNLLSVCIPTYNRAKLLREAIESILQQSYVDFELIIVDNASKDDTKEVVNSFKDPRIRYFKNSSHLGLALNWNRCIALAKNNYICIF